MRKALFILSFFSVISIGTAHAQFKDTSLKYDFPQFFRETGKFFTTPLHWNGTDFLMIGSMVVGTGIAALLEDPVRNVTFRDLQVRPLYNGTLAQIGDFYGSLPMPFILFSVYGGYSLITGDMLARKIAYEIGQSCLYAVAIVYTMKTVIGRARPFTNEGKSSFHPLELTNDDHHSFPSGHVTEAMAMSTVLAFNADPLWLKILAYTPVPFTLFSRAYQGWHWISDCVFGFGIGLFTAKWCADAHGRIDDAGQKTGSLEVKSLWPLSLCYNF
jgi:membrane-associated phospholipid phosphatase